MYIILQFFKALEFKNENVFFFFSFLSSDSQITLGQNHLKLLSKMRILRPLPQKF